MQAIVVRIFLAATVAGALAWGFQGYRRPVALSSVAWVVVVFGALLVGGAMASLAPIPADVLSRHKRILGRLSLEILCYALIGWFFFPKDLLPMMAPLALGLMLASRWIKNPVFRTLLSLSVFVVFLTLGLVAEYEAQYGAFLADTWNAVFQTNVSEAWSYAEQYLSFWPLFAATAGVLMLWVDVFSAPWPLSDKRRVELSLLGLGVVVIGLLATWVPLRQRVTNFHESSAAFRAEVEGQRRILESLRADDFEMPMDAEPASFEGTVIFIIGESTTRRHMSLYGYNRDTTPRLDARENELWIHSDTISPDSHTVPSLKEVLTVNSFEAPVSDSLAYSRSLLVELKRAGFKTWWISNQNEFGVFDNPTSLIGKQADQFHFQRLSWSVGNRPFWDHSLLPNVDEAIADGAPRAFITYHLAAGHVPYCGLIPPEYRAAFPGSEGLGAKYFGAARDFTKDVNCYDNAIGYIDHVIDQVIERAQANPKPVAVVFFADHGEDPANGTNHQSNSHSIAHIEIPHFWYFNDAARPRLTEHLEAFAENADKPFQSSDMFHAVLDLVGSKSDLVDKTRSPFSPEFVARPRRSVPIKMKSASIDGVDSVKFVAYDERLQDDLKDDLERSRVELSDLREKDAAAYRKVWAHQTNTIGKMLDLKHYVAGVEIDVAFNAATSRFHVAREGEDDVGLALDELLHAARDRPGLGVWLNWWNPEEATVSAALARLEELGQRFSLHPRAFVETPAKATFPALKTLSDHGFRQGHRLDGQRALGCASKLESPDCLSLALQTAAAAQAAGADTLSFDDAASPFVERFRSQFEDLNLASRKLDVPTHTYRFADQLPSLEPLEVLFVDFPSNFNR